MLYTNLILTKWPLFLALPVLMSLSLACQQNHPYQEELTAVDSLKQEVVKLEVTMNKVNHERVMQVKDTVYFVMSETIRRLENDSNRDHWIEQMAALEQVARAFQKYEGSNDKIREQVALSSEQLQTLQNSLEDQKIDTAEAHRYLNDESIMLKNVKYDVNRRFPMVISALEVWDSIKPAYDTLMQNGALSNTRIKIND